VNRVDETLATPLGDMSPRAVLASLFALSLALPVSGCVPPRMPQTSILHPNGVESHVLTCRAGPSRCADQARRLCPGGYVVHAYTEIRRYRYRSRPTATMLITCDEELRALARRTEAEAACADAYGPSETFAASWAARRSREVRPDFPSKRAFVQACRSLPDRARMCLDPGYRDAHPAMCNAAFDALPPEETSSLDALFFDPVAGSEGD
jgi:hypothetical protein